MKLTKKQLKIGRDWIKDCIWSDLEQNEIDELSDFQIEKGIQRNYAGGLTSFIETCEDSQIETPDQKLERLNQVKVGLQ